MTDFTDVYDRYFKDVYKYALSLSQNEIVAEEITQQTFFKALQKINEFRGECRIRVWLCQIAKNTYFSYCKQERRHVSNHEMITEYDCREETIETKFADKEMAFEIHKTLHKLEEPYKEVFTLRLFGELSFVQIAELFGKTESWARVTFYRAKMKIKEDLL